MFAPGGDMPLSRVDQLCRVLKTDFAELSHRLGQLQSLRMELSLEQERAVVGLNASCLAAAPAVTPATRKTCGL